MLQRTILSSGEKLPVMGLGTWKSFNVDQSALQSSDGPRGVLDEFAKLGGRLVDASPMYGRSEEVVGDLAADLNLVGKLFIATKVWTTGRDKGIAEMRESMRKMRASPVDLMQVHNLVDVEVQLKTLAEWKTEGLVRYTGVTHYTASAHADVARVLQRHSVDFLQINYSVAEREAEGRLLPMAMDLGVSVIANRPLATGSLIEKLRARPLPAIAQDLKCASWAQLLLKYVVSHPAMTCAIPATSHVAHLRDNMAAADGPMPDEKQRAVIARLAA